VEDEESGGDLFEVIQSLYEVKRLQIVDDEDWLDYATIIY
jgi:hypothetical protein